MARANVHPQAKLAAADAAQHSFIGEISYAHKFFLYKGVADPLDPDQLDSYIECDFSGYSRKDWPSVPNAVYNSSTERAEIGPFQVQWAHTGGPTANTVLGWGFANTGNDQVLFTQEFDSPRVMELESHELKIEVLFYVCECQYDEEEPE